MIDAESTFVLPLVDHLVQQRLGDLPQPSRRMCRRLIAIAGLPDEAGS